VSAPDDPLSLLDWKRRVAGLYADVRRAAEPAEAWTLWRQTRDELFKTHPQSPLPAPERGAFEGLPYFDYDPAHRVHAEVQDAQRRRYEIGTSGDGAYAFERFALAIFELAGESQSLELYWLEGYGGGLFLPFADATSARETYGAGRYLFDTVKGADLGIESGRLILDFNFAYNPSCSYDPSWVCPLATPANRLSVAVRAGER
jgi:uncharacterized protein (DUF1684 family)